MRISASSSRSFSIFPSDQNGPGLFCLCSIVQGGCDGCSPDLTRRANNRHRLVDGRVNGQRWLLHRLYGRAGIREVDRPHDGLRLLPGLVMRPAEHRLSNALDHAIHLNSPAFPRADTIFYDSPTAHFSRSIVSVADLPRILPSQATNNLFSHSRTKRIYHLLTCKVSSLVLLHSRIPRTPPRRSGAT